MKAAPLAMPPGNLILLFMFLTLSLDVYRTFVRDRPRPKGQEAQT